MKRTSEKVNWWRCGFCGSPVLTRRLKGCNKVVTLSRTPVYIILDETSRDVFYYNGAWVHGREHPDGIAAYRKHRCACTRK